MIEIKAGISVPACFLLKNVGFLECKARLANEWLNISTEGNNIQYRLVRKLTVEKQELKGVSMKTSVVLSSLLLGTGFFAHKNFPTAATAPVTSEKTFTYKSTKTYRNGDVAMKPIGTVSIVVDKSDYELHVYDAQGWFATYPVVFGNSTLDDKRMEGDRNTPEGTFKISSKRVHEKWNRFMCLDYPTKESYEKFKARKQRGEIPESAKIGGAIGIHGTWPNEDFQIDRYKNWTLGCVSMKNRDVQELYIFVGVGTKITIKK